MHTSLLILLVACGRSDRSDPDWLIEPMDLGSYAKGEGYTFDSPQTTWFAGEHALPELRWSVPPSNIPIYLWEDVLSGENVSDAGSCPYLTLEGETTYWSANCRSQEGYDWSGSVSLTTEMGEEQTELWEFDIDVSSDREGRLFDRVLLEGTVHYVQGDDEPLSRHAQVNIRIRAPGYWAGAFDEALDAAWTDMAISGTWEARMDNGDEYWQVDAAVDLGTHGGFRVRSEQFWTETACAGEPRGEATLTGENEARLLFEGAEACNGCAQLWLNDVRAPNACQD